MNIVAVKAACKAISKAKKPCAATLFRCRARHCLAGELPLSAVIFFKNRKPTHYKFLPNALLGV